MRRRREAKARELTKKKPTVGNDEPEAAVNGAEGGAEAAPAEGVHGDEPAVDDEHRNALESSPTRHPVGRSGRGGATSQSARGAGGLPASAQIASRCRAAGTGLSVAQVGALAQFTISVHDTEGALVRVPATSAFWILIKGYAGRHNSQPGTIRTKLIDRGDGTCALRRARRAPIARPPPPSAPARCSPVGTRWVSARCKAHRRAAAWRRCHQQSNGPASVLRGHSSHQAAAQPTISSHACAPQTCASTVPI